jgi:hypothetical protein
VNASWHTKIKKSKGQSYLHVPKKRINEKTQEQIVYFYSFVAKSNGIQKKGRKVVV